MALNWLTYPARNPCTAGGTEMSILIQHYIFNKNFKLRYGRNFFLWKESAKLVCGGIVPRCVLQPWKLVSTVYVWCVHINITYVYTFTHKIYFQHSGHDVTVIYTSKTDLILVMLFLSSPTMNFRSHQCQLNGAVEPVSRMNSNIHVQEENWDSKSVPKWQDDRCFFS